MKHFAKKAIPHVDAFFASDSYLLFNAVLVFIGWCSGAWVPVLSVVIAIAALSLFVCKSTLHLLCVFFSFTFVIRTNRHALASLAPLLVLIPLLFLSMIFYLLRSKTSFAPIHPKRIKGFHCALVALLIPFALGGIGSPYKNPIAVLSALGLVALFALGYTFLYVTNTKEENGKDALLYMQKVIFASGVLVSLELIVYFARLGSFSALTALVGQKTVDIGWAGANNVAPVLAVCLPSSFFFCLKKSKLCPVFASVGIFEFALVCLTGCRAAILFTLLALPVILFFTMAKTQNKLSFGTTLCLLFATAVLLFGLFGNEIAPLASTVLSKGLKNNGRFALYREAISVFCRFPVFGAGWGYRLGEWSHDSYTPYWFHSTALQITANMGIVGGIGFLFFFFRKYASFGALRKRPEVIFMLVGALIFDACGMVDVNFFGPTFFVMMLCISLVVDVSLPKDKCLAFFGKNPFADIPNAFLQTLSYLKMKRKSTACYTRQPKCNVAKCGGDFESERNPKEN